MLNMLFTLVNNFSVLHMHEIYTNFKMLKTHSPLTTAADNTKGHCHYARSIHQPRLENVE